MVSKKYVYSAYAFFSVFAVHLGLVVCNPVKVNCTENCPNSKVAAEPNTAAVLQTTLPSLSLKTSAVNLHSNSSNATTTKKAHEKKSGGIKVAKIDFKRVEMPFVVCSWILIASLAKIGFHLSTRLSTLMPESCLLILLGIPIGLALRAAGLQQSSFYFTSNLFFLFLLPPIILEAGYFMPIRAFYSNFGTILLYATLGTIFNSFAVGVSLYASGAVVSIPYSLMHALLFGSLISAVDPVAVLAVFEEVQVHEILYILVFGESVLNDAASVVLYHTFEAMANMSIVTAKQVILAVVSFLVVSLGGTCIGVIWGLATSFVTRFTKHVLVIEPVFIFIMSYMAYLTAEIFHFSGIMAILFCGIIMKPYVESNISRKSHTTIKYFMKLLSSCCETIIFMFLGVSLVMDKHRWNTSFVFLTLFFITVYRAIGVIVLTAIANKLGRLSKIGKTEQFIMSYGGLRGAVAFCLAVLLDKKHMSLELREMLITTAMVVVIFTVFIQGTTIKPLVRFLKIKRHEKQEITMTGVINDRILDHLVAGVEEIIGHHGHSYWRAMIEHFNKKYLRPYLERDPDKALDEEIILANRKMAFKKAMQMAENPSVLFEKTDDLSAVRRNPSYAFALSLRGNGEVDENQPPLDTRALTARSNEEQEQVIKHNISFVIPRARAPKLSLRARTLSNRKYSLASLDEPDDEIPCRYNKYKRNALAHMAPTKTTSQHRQGKEHRHHHRRKSDRKHLVHQTHSISESNEVDSINEAQVVPSFSVDGGITFKAGEHEMDRLSEPLLGDHVSNEPLGPVPSHSEPVRDCHFDETIDKEAGDLEKSSLMDPTVIQDEPKVTVHGSPQRMRSLERQECLSAEEEM